MSFFFLAMHYFSLSAHSTSIYQYYSFLHRETPYLHVSKRNKIRCDMHPNADRGRRQQIHLAANWEKQLQLRAPALGWDSEIGWIIYIFRAPLQFADRFQSGKKHSTLTSEQIRICVALPCPTGLHAVNLSLIGEGRFFFFYLRPRRTFWHSSGAAAVELSMQCEGLALETSGGWGTTGEVSYTWLNITFPRQKDKLLWIN